MLYGTKVDSPLGVLGLSFDAEGALVAVGWNRLEDGARPVRESKLAEKAAGKVAKWLEDYFAKDFREIDFEMKPAGTPYQQSVWFALTSVPCGYTASYKDIALKIKSGARAVGTANGRNPIPLIIPCHRIVAADGTIGGYSGGTEKLPALKMKKWLLEHEDAGSW